MRFDWSTQNSKKSFVVVSILLSLVHFPGVESILFLFSKTKPAHQFVALLDHFFLVGVWQRVILLLLVVVFDIVTVNSRLFEEYAANNLMENKAEKVGLQITIS